MIQQSWGDNVGEEARKNFTRWVSEGFISRYLSGENVLDIGFEGYIDGVTPITPSATGVGLDYPDYDGETLPFTDQSQDAVFASHCLEHIDDYRGAIAEWFRVVKVGGYLIIAVPHQYLYERKLTLPSRFNADHRRFYTPASLLREVEEAIDPQSYRLRLLEDNDRGFDYSIEPELHAGGSYEILMVLEKIERPKWADQVQAPPEIRTVTESMFVPRQRPGASVELRQIESHQPPTSIIAFKMDHLGDFILAKPALMNLRRAFPEAQLTLVCGEWNENEARAMEIFDHVLPFSFFARNPALNDEIPFSQKVSELLNQLEDLHFDLAVDLRVDEDTRIILKHINARQKAGIGYSRDFPYLDIALPMMSSTRSGRSGEYVVNASQFQGKVGQHRGHQIEVPGGLYPQDANLIWGPYKSLDPGRYRIRALMADEPGDVPPLNYDLVCVGGDVKLAAGSCEQLATAGVWFDLDEPVRDLELRIWGRGQRSGAFRFRGCTISKEGVMQGPHQSEMMAMLVALVEQRMRFSPTDETIS